MTATTRLACRPALSVGPTPTAIALPSLLLSAATAGSQFTAGALLAAAGRWPHAALAGLR